MPNWHCGGRLQSLPNDLAFIAETLARIAKTKWLLLATVRMALLSCKHLIECQIVPIVADVPLCERLADWHCDGSDQTTLVERHAAALLCANVRARRIMRGRSL